MKPLTGRKVLLIAVSSFGVILAANLVLAVQAVKSFPGLEVANSYVASQKFDARRGAQVNLGWELSAGLEDGQLVLAFTNSDGRPVEVASLDATLGRATHVRDDLTPDFSYRAGVFRAPVDLAPGNWNIRLVATAPDGTAFRQRVVLHVREG
jgi:nitrogen fixation protein FixH